MNAFASQHGEDKWLFQNWNELHLPEFGYFVEFGAGNGVYLSNTYWLEHSRGWHGLLIEPDPRNAIRNRPRSFVERLAVGPKGTMTLGCPADPYLTGARRTADEPQEVIRAHSTITVPSEPLSSILDRHGVDGIDVMSIDTEGTELDAWRTLNLKRWRPRVAIIELITWGLPDVSDYTTRAIEADGYRLACRTHHNGIFVDVRP